jgi:hypothetical protein
MRRFGFPVPWGTVGVVSEWPTTTLWRPVGHDELVLVEQSGWSRFPPRLPEQPIFYPVCNERYAREIAERWNARYGGRGYVLQFAVETRFLAKFEVHVVGAAYHQEYWIPAEDLDSFNAALVVPIKVVVRYGHDSEG